MKCFDEALRAHAYSIRRWTEQIVSKKEKLDKKLKKRNVVHAKNADEAVGALNGKLKAEDIVLTLGAGDVWKVGELLIEKLKARK